jgi:hypothetical protein
MTVVNNKNMQEKGMIKEKSSIMRQVIWKVIRYAKSDYGGSD